MKIANLIIAVSLILFNIYFLPISIASFSQTGLHIILIMALTFSAHLLLIPAGLAFVSKFRDSLILLIINGLGLVWAGFCFLVLNGY